MKRYQVIVTINEHEFAPYNYNCKNKKALKEEFLNFYNKIKNVEDKLEIRIKKYNEGGVLNERYETL